MAEQLTAAGHQAKIIAYSADPTLGYAELAELIQEQLPLAPFVILGESFSGPLAIEIAATEKERVKGLVLAGSFAKHPLPRLFAPLSKLYHRTLAPLWLVRLLLLSGFGDRALKDKVSSVLRSLPNAVVRKRLSEVVRVDKTAQLSEINCPLVYLRGTKDWLIGKASVDLITQHSKDCKIVEIPGPHLLLSVNAQNTAQYLARFSLKGINRIDRARDD